jgi:predicted ATPase
MLLLLDSCEHVIDAAAELVAKLLRFTERLSVLVTSREALRAEGEWVQRIPPLTFPQPGVTPTAEEALRFAAVQLFVERAAEGLGGYTLTDSDAPLVADLCRKLDGIALAIELAAGRTNTLSVRDLASQLDDRFRLLKHGRRTAVPRHQTLRATLDWSYDSLPPVEQRLLERLAIFSGAFTATAAVSVCAVAPLAAEDIPDCLADLLAKSLLTVTLDDLEARYRLLESTRSYASEKLAASAELPILAQRHAHYVLSVFESAARAREAQQGLARYSREVQNLRAALNWAFSEPGDPELGVRLVIVAVPIWSQLSVLDESLDWVERALTASAALPHQDRRRQMQLYCALGGLQMYAIASVRKATDAWGAALQLAIELDDVDYELRALRAVWAEAINAGEYRRALQLAERFQEQASAAAATGEQAIADRLLGTALHFLGEQSSAWQAISRMLAEYSASAASSHIVRYQFDQEATARAIRARLLWVRGRSESAFADLEDTISNITASDHALTLVHVLTVAACPIALLVGDLEAARRYNQRLRALTEPRVLDIFYSYCLCFDAELTIRGGKVEDGLRSQEAPLRELRQSGFNQGLVFFLMTRARGFLAVHRASEAATTMAEALSICERTGEAWCLPELLRLQGEVALAQRSPHGTDTALGLFTRALSLARDQQALAWELRAASSLVGCLSGDDLRLESARSTLREVMAKVTEGREQPDFVAAAALFGPTGPA